jgi:hypothetical protein
MGHYDKVPFDYHRCHIFVYSLCLERFCRRCAHSKPSEQTIVKKTIRVEIDANGNKTIKQQTLNDVKVQVNGNKVISELSNGEKQTIDLSNENLNNFRAKAIIMGNGHQLQSVIP